MGISFSAMYADDDPYGSSLCLPFPSPVAQSKPSLGDLPEDCVALVLQYLDPSEICKLAKLNRAFRGASWADFVWESKLPTNYQVIVNRVFGDQFEKLGKREIYTMLCRANSFDGDTKRAWLDKSTSGVCMSIASKGLTITGIDDRRYWNHIPTEESRFGTIAYLQHVWWFEVDGEVEFPFPAGTYSLFFRLQLGRTTKRFGRRICNTENVHGWDIKPARFQLWTSDGQYASSQCYLSDPGKWIYYHAGDFVVESQNVSSTKVKFSMTQIDCTHTKGGLCLDSVLVYPSHLKERLNHF
ncbi:F-box protein PP2-A12-like [Rutidosis leptorrhynchoides]|uniref:F-box protein PP2-A12-like n=1 Tax=Rutidosis leptorrhynchoides TaxID=125765 RepID=UPI003A992A3F